MKISIESISNKLWERKDNLNDRFDKIDNGNYINKGLMSYNQGREDNLLIKSLIDASNKIEYIEEKIVDFSLLEGNEDKIKKDFKIIEVELEALEQVIIKHEKIAELLEDLKILY